MQTQDNQPLSLADRRAAEAKKPTITRSELDENPAKHREKLVKGELRIVSE